MYNSVPTIVNYPFSNISMTFSLVCSLYLLVWRLCFRQILIFIGWPDNLKTIYACEDMSAIVHSSSLCPVLFMLLMSQPYRPSAAMSSHPKWWQDGANAMIDLCIGYMIYDAFSSLIYRNYIITPGLFRIYISGGDWCFMGHHLATIIYMVSCRVLGAGQMSTMIAMFLGELTNPVQNMMLTMELAIDLGSCCTGPWIQFLYPYVRFLYGLLYASIRMVIAPLFFLHISYDLLFTKQGKKNIPFGLGIVWVTLIWGVTVGAIPWIYEAADIVKSFRIDLSNLKEEL